MKKIVYLHPHFVLHGGAGKFVLETAKCLSENKKNNIYVISGKQENHIIDTYKRENITFIQVYMPISSSFFFWLLYPIWLINIIVAIRKIHIGSSNEFVLFPQIFPSNRWGAIYKILYPSTKVVFMCQEPSAFIHSRQWIAAIQNPLKRFIAIALNPLLKIIDIYLVNKVDTIIANSSFTQTVIEKVYGRADAIIYPGYDEDKFKPTLGRNKKKYIATISRLTKFKKVDIVIDIFAQILKKYPHYILKIGGEGESKKDLESKVKKMGIEKNVQFLGKISDDGIVSFYQDATCILFSSEQEPFGIVPVEAMACGTIVVGHNSGGLKETIPEELRYNNIGQAVKIIEDIIDRNIHIFNTKKMDMFTRKSNTKKLEKLLQ